MDNKQKIFLELFEPIRENLSRFCNAISGNREDALDLASTEEKAVMDVWRGCSGALKNLKVYPNPATTKVTAEFDLEELRSYKLTINDMNGAVVKSFETKDILPNLTNGKVNINGPQTISLDLNGIESGMYYVVVETNEGEVAMQRLIVNK